MTQIALSALGATRLARNASASAVAPPRTAWRRFASLRNQDPRASAELRQRLDIGVQDCLPLLAPRGAFALRCVGESGQEPGPDVVEVLEHARRRVAPREHAQTCLVHIPDQLR